MMAKVRQTLFNMLGMFDLWDESASMLDLFSGTGVVGLEALSRGLGNVTFVDYSRACTNNIARNCKELGFLPEQHQVVKARAETVLSSPDTFGVTGPVSLVTVTPPYEEVSYAKLLEILASSPALGEDSVAVVEYPKEVTLPDCVGDGRLVGYRNRDFGRTKLAFYICSPSGQLELRMRPEEFDPSARKR